MRGYATDGLIQLGRSAVPSVTRVLVVPRIVEVAEPPTWIDARAAAAAIGTDAADLPLALIDAQAGVRRARAAF